MKPKYRRIAKFLPAIISISMAATSSAALFFVDTAGNGLPASVNNGTTTIIADGGAGPQDPTPTVTIDGTINMTGDAAQTGVIEVSGPNAYTIDIATGASLAGTVADGIHVFDPPAATTVNNSGTVSGTDDGIDFDGDFGAVNNLSGGVITGGNTGIEADDDLTVTNDGSITGTGGDGINADNDASITNNVNGMISGGDDGVDIDLRGTVNNNGSITGADDGIFIGSGDDDIVRSVVNNNTNFDIFANPISGGTITGGDTGILGGDFLTVNNRNLATITGNGDDGINANDFAIINNFSGGTITGALSGVQVDDDLVLVNGGTIEGLATNGIWAPGGDRADITNDGLIRGGEYGILVDDDLVLNNGFFGTITGTLEDGVQSDDGANIINSGFITGGDDGIFVDDNATITNNAAAFITGGNFAGNIGVRVGENSTVTNMGSITGDIGIDSVSSTSFLLENNGTITGTNGSMSLLTVAVDGGTGDDVVNLMADSVINGDINLKAGVDEVNFMGSNLSTTVRGNVVIGNITGVETITKSGGGVALVGEFGDPLFNVEADTINITGGGLYINADIAAADGVSPSVINAGGVALGGTGTWNADVNVTGGGFSAGAIPINLDLDPTNAVGTLNLDGNVTHSPVTFIRHDIVTDGAPAFLADDDIITHSGGTYALGANTDIRVSATNNDTVIRDGVYTVVDSDSLITGGFPDMAVQFNANVNAIEDLAGGIFFGSLRGDTGVGNTQAVLNLFMESDFTGGGSNLVFTVDHDYEGLGLNSNQASLGAALDASVGLDPTLSPENALIQDFIAALDYSDLGTVQATLGDLTSLDSFSTAAAITSSNHQTNRVVQDHLAMTRSQVGEISRTYVGTYSVPAPEPTIGNTFNVWGSVSYDWKDSSGFATDIDGEEASFLAGIDYRVAPSFLLGILLEGSTADYDFSGGGSDVDSFRAAIYGTYGESTGFYADFLVGYGDHDFDSERNGILGTYDTDTDAESLQAMLTVGYAMQSGSVKHGPFGGVEYSEVDVDGYTQGGLLPIGIDDYDVESTRLLIGYRLEAEAGRFTPYLSVAYAHELDDDNQSTTGTLPGGATFGIDGGQLDSAVLISAGTGITLTESLGLNVGYHGEISTGDGIDSHGGTIGLNYAF